MGRGVPSLDFIICPPPVVSARCRWGTSRRLPFISPVWCAPRGLSYSPGTLAVHLDHRPLFCFHHRHRLATARWFLFTQHPVPLLVSEAFPVTPVQSPSAGITVDVLNSRTLGSSDRSTHRSHAGTVLHACWLNRAPPPVLHGSAAIAHVRPPASPPIRGGHPPRLPPMRHRVVP